ncbi:MAG TPA: helix-hairpin-helix domain-containing protein [Candidatus Angelobacter sp.]|nr:helix-hairpin-helix domain-containing protein [Candidatus Angelobacter sp.]
MQLQERQFPRSQRQPQALQIKARQLRARRLKDLVSIGPAMLRDFELLGIHTVQQLARQSPTRLYQKLCRITAQPVDICCQDVFFAAVAQARNPLLPADQCQWWYWSRQRKARNARG